MSVVTKNAFSAGGQACIVRLTFDDVTEIVSSAGYTLNSGIGTFSWKGSSPVTMLAGTHVLPIPGTKTLGLDGYLFTWRPS